MLLGVVVDCIALQSPSLAVVFTMLHVCIACDATHGIAISILSVCLFAKCVGCDKTK